MHFSSLIHLILFDLIFYSMELYVMHFCVSFTVPLRHILTQYFVLKHLQHECYPKSERPNFTPRHFSKIVVLYIYFNL